jgi:hypothetical protein
MVLERLERARIAFSSIRGTVRCDAPVNIAYRTVTIAHTCTKQSVVASRHDSVSVETYPCFAVGTQQPARVLYSGAGLARGAAAAPMHEPHSTVLYARLVREKLVIAMALVLSYRRECHWEVTAYAPDSFPCSYFVEFGAFNPRR